MYKINHLLRSIISNFLLEYVVCLVKYVIFRCERPVSPGAPQTAPGPTAAAAHCQLPSICIRPCLFDFLALRNSPWRLPIDRSSTKQAQHSQHAQHSKLSCLSLGRVVSDRGAAHTAQYSIHRGIGGQYNYPI